MPFHPFFDGSIYAADGCDQPPPFGVFGGELLLANWSEPVILELAFAGTRRIPLCAHPSFAFETMERRIE